MMAASSFMRNLRASLLGCHLSRYLRPCSHPSHPKPFLPGSVAASYAGLQRHAGFEMRRGVHGDAAAGEKSVREPVSSGIVRCAKLDSRRLVRLAGPDATELLQGLVTNDTGVMWGQDRVMYTMFLNTQGRVLFDVMCYRVSSDASSEPSFLLECDASIQEKLMRHLKMYRVRKKADISSVDNHLQTWAVFCMIAGNESAVDSRLALTGNCEGQPTDVKDPRVKGFGRRVILPKDESLTRLVPNSTEASADEYALHRYQWGVPEGVTDLPPGESLPLESNLAFMNGVSFTKGCYLGQELTARTHHTGVTRKRIMPIHIRCHGSSPPRSGAKIMTDTGSNAGKLRSCLGNHGLALLRVAMCKDRRLLIIIENGIRTEFSSVEPTWWPRETEQRMTQ